jgi:acid phosphatase (class A)
VAVVAIVGGSLIWHQQEGPHYLTGDPSRFAASFDAPSPADSPATRRELDVLLSMQSARTSSQVEAARADRKTEIRRFFGALGLDPQRAKGLRKLDRLADRVEDDVRIHVRAVKNRFRRLRPYEIEPRLEPCIADVKGDLSYPSGHAAYAFAMAGLLSLMVPEREAALQARAEEFARQRMLCGVHFRSDIEAGRLAAERLMQELEQSPGFKAELREATLELRAMLDLPPLDGGPITSVSSARSRRIVSRLRRSSRLSGRVSSHLSAGIPRTCAAARAAPT